MPVNNPFSQPSGVVQDTAQRFPDVLAQDPDLQQPSYPQYGQPQQLQQQYTGFQQPQQPYQQPLHTGYPQQPFLAPQQTGFGGGAPSPYGAPSPGPGGAYSYQPSPSSFNTSDLDPYASLGALGGGGGGGASSGGAGGQGQPGGTLLQVQQTQSHPRQFVHENKAQLMVWDEGAWRALFARVDALREAWEKRKAGVQAAANQGADPTSADQLRRQAEDYVDSIHAARMQLNEVKTGWRHSTDPASKARVREALNAGLSSLPEYPSPLHPQDLGGAFYRQAEDSYRKSGIMAQFSAPPPPQQGGYGGMQPQQTGYGYGYAGQQQQQQGYGGGMQPQMTGYLPQQQTGFYGAAGAGGYGGQQGFY
ncbi:hypothetical protein JCM10213_000373 [Rhodosporidiobolus nylandii]